MTNRLTTIVLTLLLTTGSALAYAPHPANLSLSIASRSPVTSDCSPVTVNYSLSSIPTVQSLFPLCVSVRDNPFVEPAPLENPHICCLFCGNNPVNNSDPLGLAWMLAVRNGRAIVYENGSIFLPKTRGVSTVGNYVEGPEYDYMSSRGWGRTRDRSVVFEHGGIQYEMGVDALGSALRNISSDLTKQMLFAETATRQSLLFNFLVQGIKPSGSVKAKVAGTLDSAFSIFAGSTAFGDPMMNTHECGGLIQELFGVDFRDPTYLGITKYIDVGTDFGAGLMTAGGTYTGIKQGIILGGDRRISPGQITADVGPLRSRIGIPPANMKNPQAHHDLPQAARFAKYWDQAGLDNNYPAFGRWVEGGKVGTHQRWSSTFGAEWDFFFEQFPEATLEPILQQWQRLRTDPRFQ